MKRNLYRAKRKDNRDWIEGSLVTCDDRAWIFPNEGVYLENYCTDMIKEIIPETVGQFTGLTDSKDTKIFEGDIVRENWSKVFASKNNHLVRWEDGSCGFEPLSDSINNCGHCGGALNPDWVEVVGNIHDNPEMLEDKTNEST